MHKRNIGSLECSAIGLGCMNMSMGYGAADDAESGKLLSQALDEGYTFFDTARLYGEGHNEKLIGKHLSDKRQQFVLATKCGLQGSGMDGRPETITAECHESLSRLNTDVIDLYYLHRADPKVPIEESVSQQCNQSIHYGRAHLSEGYYKPVTKTTWRLYRSLHSGVVF